MRLQRGEGGAVMQFAYADPPYLGSAKFHYGDPTFDSKEAHLELVSRLVREYPDGWALSCNSKDLRWIYLACPETARVGAWVKPFAVFKPNVNPAYAWEPVIFYGGRKRSRYEATVRDWHSANVTLKKGLCGAKPESFCRWVLDVLGWKHGDTLDDLFPGTGAMTNASRGPVMRIGDAEKGER
jgi:hypothetical protein